MSKILITRAAAQGQKFIDQFCDVYGENYRSLFFLESMIRIRSLPYTTDLNSYDAFLATSQNAICDELPDKPLYRVGDDGISNVQDLVEHVRNLKRNKNDSYLYLRGRDVRFDLKSELASHGYLVDEVITYEALAAEHFSKNVLGLFNASDVKSVTFFSRRTADVFVQLSKEYEVMPHLKEIKVLCISDGVLDFTYTKYFKDVRVAKKPDAHGMMKLIKDFTDEQHKQTSTD